MKKELRASYQKSIIISSTFNDKIEKKIVDIASLNTRDDYGLGFST
jgi:hypothetical protein